MSSVSKSNKSAYPQSAVIGLALIALFSLGGYVLAAGFTFRIGFPLDDAWIHQTYARNLALRGEWSFIPGAPSAGSTAPLWTLLLAPGFWMGLSPFPWTFCLGWLILAGLAIAGSRAVTCLQPMGSRWAFGAGCLLALEWHLVWAAGSGMETLLIGLIALGILSWLACGKVSWFFAGGFIGLAGWIRPDGITLLGPVIFTIFLSYKSWKNKTKELIVLLLGFFLLFLPYLGFNYLLAGTWWPNTFFAKQAEYMEMRQAGLILRFAREAALPMIGVGILLLPGFFALLIKAWKQKRWAVVAGGIWIVGYLFLYAWRLPVTYQHGRYIMPVIPIYLLYGYAGMVGMVRLDSKNLAARVAGKAWVAATAAVTLVFWVQGALAFGRDVAVIESEMVETAHWIAKNTTKDDVIAAHDIGALGFFGGRDLVDLAGLVSPEVIPFIRDEEKLAAYLIDQQVGYLVSFPSWYPNLVKTADMVYRTQAQFSLVQGGENMAVYIWNNPANLP